MHAVVALALPAVEAFDLAIPAQVFGDRRQNGRYNFTVCAPVRGLVSNVAQLADRNRAFAATGARRNVPALPFIPFLNLYIVTCIDCRVDPAEILGIKLGEALVERNIGGRVTPAVIRDIAYAGYLVESKAPEGPWFEVAIIHHTDCGSTLLADDELRHGFAGADRRRRADPDRCARP